MKQLIFYSFISILFYCCNTIDNKNGNNTFAKNEKEILTNVPLSIDTQKIKRKAKEAYQYVGSKNMSKDWCILIDMSLHSGVKRWIQWDFKHNKIISEAITTHGCGTKNWANDHSKTKPSFSNIPESHLSSLGKYRIGERGHSSWGIGVKYILHGLDTTNNNAAKRFIVLHSWEKVSDAITYPKGAPESWGCPAVSNAYMQYIDKEIQAVKKPILLWIFTD